MSQTGVLYGVGVGPGDPEYLTLAAVDRLKKADVILAASSTKNKYSVALDIARPHLPDNIRVEMLKFPMTRDKTALQRAWDENAAITAGLLDQGKKLAFLTLGDPMLYSTFGYLLKTLREIRPEAQVEIIPGITSFQAAAARTKTILAESGENFMLFSGVDKEERLKESMDRTDNMVIMKSYKNFKLLREIITGKGLGKSTVFASRLGLEGETVLQGLDEAPEKPHYLTLLLVKNRKGGSD